MKLFYITASLAMAAAFSANAQAPAMADKKPELIAYGKTAPAMQVALWAENGKPMVARGAEAVKAAPATATIANVHVLALGVPNFRQVVFPKGAKILPPAGPTDTLVYVLKGHMKLKLGDSKGEVGPGDAYHKVAGQDNFYEVIEETTIVETDYVPPAPK